LEETENQLREEIEEEREIHDDAMKAMDNFYWRNPPRENIILANILRQFEQNYLKISRENQNQKKEIKELKGTIEAMNKLAEPETQDQATQTDLSSQDYEQQQQEIQDLRKEIKNIKK